MRPSRDGLYVSLRVGGGARPERPPRLALAHRFGHEITAVLGLSGAGKTTLLHAIAGLLEPDEGSVVLDGEVLFDAARGLALPPHERRIGLVFQSLALFPHRSVWQNVAYGMRETARAERRAKALEWLDRVRALGLAERSVTALSGGEAQRVALARALASEPRALLLDEPFAALDEGLRRELGALLRELVRERPVPTLLVTHHLDDAVTLAASTLTLTAGQRLDAPFAP